MHPTPHAQFELRSAPVAAGGADAMDALAARLAAACQAAQFRCSAIERWHGAGWRFRVVAGALPFEIYFARYAGDTALLGVAPPPGRAWLARLLRRPPPRVGDALRSLCDVVHGELVSYPGVGRLAWMFGGPPSRRPPVLHPRVLPWPAEG